MQTQQSVSVESAVMQVGETPEAGKSTNNQYLTFIMANEEYGVDILCVQEIRGWESATPLPNAPPHIKGVINLRGTIVPIIDLRQCFGLNGIEYTPVTVVIVLKVQTSDGSRTMGIVVDAVSDVYSLSENDMRSAPDLGNAVNTDFIRGLVNVDEKMVILLDIDKLLTLDDIPNLSSIADKLSAESIN
ncbi:chemotaxis protein CheW [Teredinibacter sp. KSP-S5-2]|uniref:chemotaxis protein CheW n=1 Tax=Teredinibacter sp. KSP-S5-2 TaxID=3034506 RepID=UPI0029347B12|nr:chemotaxis protein CheW [Teredinibacter sp. KSP-S5-2]WNO07914.1 chemotaxis protein CheW [Teredinibacter sp. KSP-S5-2]